MGLRRGGIEEMNEHDATEIAYKNGYKRGRIDAVRELAALNEVLGVLWPIAKRAAELYAQHPSKRVKHLALHAKKQRTRKKNMRRLARDLLKEAANQ
jgi:hypothetical protein